MTPTNERPIYMPPLHPGQQMVQQSAARFRVMACGRRWGKSRLAALLLLARALQGGNCWWISPSYSTGQIGFDEVRRLGVQIPGCEVNRSERFIALPGGGRVTIKSADDPSLLRGFSLDACVFDEAAFMPRLEEVWQEVIRPSLADRRGWALFASTPKGRNQFWQLFQNGLDPSQPDWAAWQFPTSSNPYIPPSEVEAMRASMTDAHFRQECLAEFIEAGSVFRNVSELATAQPAQPIPGHQYYIGVDIARSAGGDYTAIAVYDATNKAMAWLDRFSGVEYSMQVDRLTALLERYKPIQCSIEVNGPGQAIYEQVRSKKPATRLHPFTTTNQSKSDLVHALSLALERQEIRLLADPVLIGEMLAYEAVDLPSGATRYSHPAGGHDDTVDALLMAYGPCADASPLKVAQSTMSSKKRAPSEKQLDRQAAEAWRRVSERF